MMKSDDFVTHSETYLKQRSQQGITLEISFQISIC